ncbi:iron-containing redox enzyme family protein [Phenylobacterium sp.]|uniref:iron-containing redox enzyme family protein n=1 Tax=Phenylobacterium sp. TaxID=1871053 RepID=UPI000B1A3958|nr:iron-containing redox enzyme family protein [Phenylobacterium sp.]
MAMIEGLALDSAPAAGFADPDSLHRGLARWNRQRLSPGVPRQDWRLEMSRDHRMQLRESEFVEAFRARVTPMVEDVPTDPEGFIAWFEELKNTGPGQWDPLFDWLATEADLEQIRWFLTQEAAGEAGFDDLVAMTQVKLPARPKLELARNYWDEMGRGNMRGMHGPMLDMTVEGLRLEPTIEGTLWQSLALANTMTAFATTRRYAYHSVGALGVVELTAPTRVASVAAGLKRLGVEPKMRKYFDLHAVLDVEHSKAWNAEALTPLAEDHPHTLKAIAEGAVMRLLCGEQCFEAYRAVLWTGAQTTSVPQVLREPA